MNRFAVKLYSKFTGDTIFLGSIYRSKEAAVEYADTLCDECNSVQVYELGEHQEVWKNKDIGFVSCKRENQINKSERGKNENTYPNRYSC